MKQRVALIDLDIIVHKSCFYHQYRMDENDPNLKQTCIDAAIELTREWGTLCMAEYIIPVYSEPGGKTFRHELYSEYKQHRKDKPKPIYRNDCITAVLKEFGGIAGAGIEADDVMSILHTWPHNERTDHNILPFEIETVLVTTDKDMKQVPGFNFNPDKDWEPVYITQYIADYNFFVQLLMGDSVDNIKGIPGIGKVKAERFVDEWFQYNEPFNVYKEYALQLYLDQGLSIEDFKINYELVRILTMEDEWHGALQLKQRFDELILDQNQTEVLKRGKK